MTTSMVGLEDGHIRKHLTQNGEPQGFSWGTQKKKIQGLFTFSDETPER